MEDAVQWSSVAVLLQIKFVLKERLFTSSSCIPFLFFPLTLQSLHWLSSLIVTLLLTHYVEELVGVEKGKSILLGQLQQWPVCLGNMHNEITVVLHCLRNSGVKSSGSKLILALPSSLRSCGSSSGKIFICRREKPSLFPWCLRG